jgi:hypothetical protein
MFGLFKELVRFMKNNSKFRIGKYLPHTFLIQNGLKTGEGSSPLLFTFSSEATIRKVEQTPDERI